MRKKWILLVCFIIAHKFFYIQFFQVDEEVQVKKEFSPEDITNLYKNVTEIPKMYFEQVVEILNESGGWHDLATLLDLDHLIDSDIIDKENPASNLLNVALVRNKQF